LWSEISLTQRSYSVSYSKPDGAFAKRYPALGHLPFILDSRPGYHRLANLYLIDRGLGLWQPGQRVSGRIPTEQTIHTYAQWLANFLEWADTRGIEIETCSYAIHVAGRYQSEMLKGTWSRDINGCSPGTVNLRVQQACDFLVWMVEKGYREPFQIPYSTAKLKIGSATSSRGHLTRDVAVREGKAPVSKSVLRMPSDEDVRAWLRRIYEKAAPVVGLMCKSVLLTAMRREEIVCIRKDTLPENPKDWHIANPTAPISQQQVRISIKFGTKGSNFGTDHADKIGPERSILIPLTLAQEWDDYRRHSRNLAFKKWMEGVNGSYARRQHAQDCVHLFLNEETGERFTGRQLYDAWVSVPAPVDEWSPHSGRHWWSCSTLWRELKKHENLPHLNNETATALLESTAMSIIRLQIQPQLGHAQDSTTMIYLDWVMDMLGRPLTLDDEESEELLG
jgi:integrase